MKSKDDFGNPFRTKSQAQRARQIEMVKEREAAAIGEKKKKRKRLKKEQQHKSIRNTVKKDEKEKQYLQWLNRTVYGKNI